MPLIYNDLLVNTIQTYCHLAVKGEGVCFSGRTFHCRVRVLLVRWESFGVSGTSGAPQCVVNEPASEHEPRAELYIADTLERARRLDLVETPRI